jgi:hypothetical protein
MKACFTAALLTRAAGLTASKGFLEHEIEEADQILNAGASEPPVSAGSGSCWAVRPEVAYERTDAEQGVRSSELVGKVIVAETFTCVVFLGQREVLSAPQRSALRLRVADEALFDYQLDRHDRRRS